MVNMISELIGFAAAFCTTAAFIPQVIHSIKTQDLSGISLGMYSIFSFGVACWLVYGLMLLSWPMIIANSITLVLACTLLVLKIKHLNQPRED